MKSKNELSSLNSVLTRLYFSLLSLFITKRNFLNPIPAELMLQVAIHLTQKDLKQLKPANKLMWSKFHTVPPVVLRKNRLFITPLNIALSEIITETGENNLIRVERILKMYPALVNNGISNEINWLHDSAGHLFETPLSIYGYCFWVGDTKMCEIMQPFMDNDAKLKVHAECTKILAEGISVNGNKNVTHYDLDPLILAYEAFRTAHEAENDEDRNAACIRIIEEQKKLPLWIIQTYCAGNLSKNRTIQYRQIIIEDNESVWRTFSWPVNGKHRNVLLLGSGEAENNWHGNYYYSGTPYDRCHQILEDEKMIKRLKNQFSHHLEKAYHNLSTEILQEEIAFDQLSIQK